MRAWSKSKLNCNEGKYGQDDDCAVAEVDLRQLRGDVMDRNIAEQSSEDRPLVICLLNAPSNLYFGNLYFGATHQKHIIENAFLIQTHNMLARKTRSTSPRIFSKSKPQNRAKPNSYIFTAIGLCCDLTISSCDFPISWQMAHAAI